MWGTVEHNYYGVNLLKSHVELEPEEMPVGVIKSPVIEKAKTFTGDEKYKFWTRYFIDSLTKAENSLLYEGLYEGLFRLPACCSSIDPEYKHNQAFHRPGAVKNCNL